MPELPDLQVFAANLQKKLKRKELRAIELHVSKKIHVPEKELNKQFGGKKLTHVYRQGKQLYFDFGKDAIFSIHLMLHGKLILQPAEEALPKHSIISFNFDSENLILTDFQKIATVTLNPEPPKGMDALSEKLDAQWLSGILNKSRSTIKSILMDQDIIAGIGNAYADEILYDALVAPQSKSNKIPEAAVKKIAHSIHDILKNAEKQILKADPERISGEFRDFLSVHNSKLEKTQAGEKILTQKIGGRTTYYTESQEEYK
jgi:formamidopyrimidine-DNA glycosylase